MTSNLTISSLPLPMNVSLARGDVPRIPNEVERLSEVPFLRRLFSSENGLQHDPSFQER